MARLPKSPSEALDALRIREGSTVLAVGPDHGFAAALADRVGQGGRVVVQAPPPEEEAERVEVVEELPDDVRADAVLVWIGVVGVHDIRQLVRRVTEGGVAWVVLPRGERETRAPVTEGEVKRAMLATGWRELRVVPLSTEALAVGFVRRRDRSER